MKNTILLLVTLSIFNLAFGANVKIKITYKGKGISGHTVNLYMAGNHMDAGVTNQSGEVTFNVSSIITKSVDLKGEKTCNGGKKSWDVKGFVTLDNNNFGHLKMEGPIKEMVEASGGFMSEKLLVSSYGLICGGTSNRTKKTSSNTSRNKPSKVNEVSPLITKEERLKSQRIYLESKIRRIESKITKKNDRILDGSYEGKRKNSALYFIKKMRIEKQIEENKLAKVDLEIKKGKLNRVEKNKFEDRKNRLKENLKQVERDQKKGVMLISKEEQNSEFEFTESELENMNNFDLKSKNMNLKMKIKKKKLTLKMKKRLMSPKKKKTLENEILVLEKGLKTIEIEINKRTPEVKEEKVEKADE